MDSTFFLLLGLSIGLVIGVIINFFINLFTKYKNSNNLNNNNLNNKQMKDKIKVKIKGVLDLYDKKGKVENLQLAFFDVSGNTKSVVVYTKSNICCGDEYLFEPYDKPVNLNMFTAYSDDPMYSYGKLHYLINSK